MRSTKQQQTEVRAARKREMVLRLSIHLKLSKATTYEALPAHVRLYFENIRYCDVVKPLILADNAAGFSVQRLAIKYGLSSSTIQGHLTRLKQLCGETA